MAVVKCPGGQFDTEDMWRLVNPPIWMWLTLPQGTVSTCQNGDLMLMIAVHPEQGFVSFARSGVRAGQIFTAEYHFKIERADHRLVYSHCTGDCDDGQGPA